jgi:hypothetical protein
MYGHLPANFDQWDLTDSKGFMVAHVAARHGPLPVDFQYWALVDVGGRTVALVAACHGVLPDTFDKWPVDCDGDAMIEAACESRRLTASQLDSLLDAGVLTERVEHIIRSIYSEYWRKREILCALGDGHECRGSEKGAFLL